MNAESPHLTKRSASRGPVLGAMFLMATSAIGPGFITQTTQFTAQLGAAFAFAILASIVVDIALQMNVWRVIGVSGLRAQELGERLLPTRTSKTLPPDLSKHALTLVEQYRLSSDLHQFRVRAGSSLIGRARATMGQTDRGALTFVTIEDGKGNPIRTGEVKEGDVLVIRGPAEQAADLAGKLGLSFRDDLPEGAVPVWHRQAHHLTESEKEQLNE